MKQFVVIAYDYKDAGALERRMAARAEHIAKCDTAVERGEQIFGAALKNDAGQMCGSVMVFNVPDRATLDAWMASEPYVTGKVWEKIEVMECGIGPSFLKFFPGL